MLEATSCTRVLGQPTTLPLIQGVQSALVSKGVNLRMDNLPSMELIYPTLCDLPDGEVNVYPPSLQPVNLDDPAMFIHSSGSTGLPKSVPLSHRRILEYMERSKQFPIF